VTTERIRTWARWTPRATVRQTVEAIRQLATPEGVTVKQLADHLQLERSAAQYRVQAARDGGFIVSIENRRGMPARHALDNPLPAEVALLPETIPETFHTPTRADHAEHTDPQATEGVKT
jgi:DNA-binding transcriptional regulator LsrR (DeoR family)